MKTRRDKTREVTQFITTRIDIEIDENLDKEEETEILEEMFRNMEYKFNSNKKHARVIGTEIVDSSLIF